VTRIGAVHHTWDCNDCAGCERDKTAEKLAAALARVAELEALFQRTHGCHYGWVAKAEEAMRLERELADVHALEEAACRLGTDTGVPSQIPGFEPDGSDHLHFVLMPIGARSRRAAVEYLKKEGKDG
jgi:hypothetical protein